MQQVEWCSFEIDSWSELQFCRKYLGVHIHYTKKDGQVSKAGIFLDFSWSSERETSDYIATKLESVIRRYFSTNYCIVSLIHDRGANVKKVHTILDLTAHFCYAHLTHNTVTVGLMSLTATTDLKRKQAATNSIFTRSTHGNSVLESVQEAAGLTVKHVVQMVDQRWMSFFSSGMKTMELGPSIAQSLQQLPHASGTYKNAELRLLHHVLLMLQPLHDFTDKCINRAHQEHISIVTVLSSSVNLFVFMINKAFLVIQQWWTYSIQDMRDTVDLDATTDDSNWPGLASAFAVILLQITRHYLFDVLLQRLRNTDRREILMVLVGASLDPTWESAYDLAKKNSLLACVNTSNVKNLKIADVNNTFMAAAIQAHCDYSGNANDFLSSIDDRIKNLSDDLDLCEETIKPLSDQFKRIDIEDTVAILFNLHTRFVADVSAFNDALYSQLQLFVEEKNLRANTPGTEATQQERSPQNEPSWNQFASYTSFSSSSEINARHMIIDDSDNDNGSSIPPNNEWDRLRELSKTKSHAEWIWSPQSDNVDHNTLIQIHRAVSTCQTTSSRLERNFSDATRHQDDLQTHLHPDKTAIEVKLSRNFGLQGFPSFSEAVQWTKTVPQLISQRQAEYNAEPTKFNRHSNEASPTVISPNLSRSSTATTLVLSPPASRAALAVSIPSTPPAPSISQRSPSSSPYVQPSRSRERTPQVVLVDQFVREVHTEGAHFLTQKARRDGLNDAIDLEQTAVENLKELSKKRAAPDFPTDDLVDLSDRRKNMLRYLRRDIDLSVWNLMLNDVGCKLSSERKFFIDLWDFASEHMTLPQMIAALRTSITRDSDYMEDMRKWREEILKTEQQTTTLEAPSYDMQQPPVANSATIGFANLPNVAIIPPVQENPGTAAQDAAEVTDPLNASLLANNLVYVDVGGRGDCFFKSAHHSIQQLPLPMLRQLQERGLNGFTPIRLRRFAVAAISAGWEAYDEFRTSIHGTSDPEPKNVWLMEMNKSGRWADNIVIQALCDRLGIHFVIFRDNGSIVHIYPVTGEYVCTLSLVLRGEYHYQSTQPSRM